MNKCFITTLALLATLMACNKEISTDMDPVSENKTTIKININKASVKATYDEETNSFAWAAGDKIGVVLEDNTIAEFELDASTAGTPEGTFSASDLSAAVLAPGYVVYPYMEGDKFEEGKLTLSFPATYEPETPNDFRLRWKGELTAVDGETGSYNTSFELTSGIFKVSYKALPEFATKVVLSADKDITDEGNTVTVTLPKGATFAYFPVPAGTYTLTVSLADEEGEILSGTSKTMKNKEIIVGTIYKTPEISFNFYQKITSKSDLAAPGTYVLAYVDGTQYNLFSFDQTMVNAQTAAESVSNVHGLGELLAQGTNLYKTVLGNNYVVITGEEGPADLINVAPAKENLAAFKVSNDDPDDGQVTFSSATTGLSLKANHIYVDFAENGSAVLTIAFDAPDLVNIAAKLRGKESLNISFKYLIEFAVEQAEKEGVTFTDAQVDRLKSGFEHLCRLAKEVVDNHPDLFNGNSLMSIDLSTNAVEVFSRYYDNALSLSESLSSEKMFGWVTPMGFYKANNGFSANISLPNYGWFNHVEASLKGDKDFCIAYWAKFDEKYPKLMGQENFFKRAATKALSELDDSTYEMLQEMANDGKFSAIGNVYKRYAERLNDDLEPVYIYKKVE